MLRVVIWYILLWKEKLSKIRPPLTLFTKKVLMISYHAEFDKIYFRYQIIYPTINQKKVKKKNKAKPLFQSRIIRVKKKLLQQ